ncbi:MAG: hypothetical protein JWO15_2678 [Sphingomonadales bacterium]|nr:hypothetical protein [Sphingomonadales bacterium]
MAYQNIRSRKAVIAAMAECRHSGRKEFREKYGFDASTSYLVHHEGVEYDSKPLLAVAHKYQFPEVGALENSFSGGKGHAARHLVRLGFEVDGVLPGPQDWRLAEVSIIVDDYFAMLRSDHNNEVINKAARVRNLLLQIPNRNSSSITRKQSNISAILKELGLPWVRGLSPLPNVQTLLEAVIYDWLRDHPNFFAELNVSEPETVSYSKAEIDPPSGILLKAVGSARRACRVDYAARDERNRLLGNAGEKWALRFLQSRLTEGGRNDLAQKVEWVSQTLGDGLGYDIASFRLDGLPEFVEVKTTNGGVGAPFILTSSEIAASGDLAERYSLLRVFEFGSDPRCYRLEGDLTKSCSLQAHVFRAVPA